MAKLNRVSDGGAAFKKRCGTCIDRKISCDREFPRCSNCVRSNRACQGYRLRLSWPRNNDRKRSLVYQPAPHVNNCGYVTHPVKYFHMVNATSWDVQRYHYLNKGRQIVTQMTRCSIPYSLVELTAGEKLLIQYFQYQISVSLFTFSDQPLGETLIRIALSENSQAGLAVQRSMLALAALYRHGLGFQAEKLKLSAIRALSASIVGGFGVHSAVQHVAAGMILCLFETRAHSETSGQWLSYLRGARNVVTAVSEPRFGNSKDVSILLEWVYYYEVLAQFSLRHWRRTNNDETQNITLEFESTRGNRPLLSQNRERTLSTWALNPLRLLSEVIAAVKSSHSTPTEAVRTRVNELYKEVERATVPGLLASPIPKKDRGTTAKVNAYNLSTLIYLNRATGNNLMPSSNISALVKTGLEMLSLARGCAAPFPLLILGWEARTDEERHRVLDFLSEAETTPPTRDLDCMRHLLHALWTQDDLHAESGLRVDYMESLTALLSSSEIVPPFA